MLEDIPTILNEDILFDFDITEEGRQVITKNIDGMEITLMIYDVPEITTFADSSGIFDMPLGNFNKRFTMPEGAPF